MQDYTLSPRLTLSHLGISTGFSSYVNSFSDSSDIVLPHFPLSASSYPLELLACSCWSLIARSQLFTLLFSTHDCYHSSNHCEVYRIVLPSTIAQISAAFSKAPCEKDASNKAMYCITDENLFSASEHSHWTQIPYIVAIQLYNVNFYPYVFNIWFAIIDNPNKGPLSPSPKVLSSWL